MQSNDREPRAALRAPRLEASHRTGEQELILVTRSGSIRVTEVELAEGRIAVVSTPARDHSFWAKLSPSERKIAGLILDGRSDRDIASHRSCSPQTVTKQIDDLFDRLGVRTRAQLAQRLIPLFPRR